MNLGADDYVTKPFSHADVIDVVKTRLAKLEGIQSQIEHLSNVIDVEREQRLLKSLLVGMFSHDFRNPLASIMSSVAILQNYLERLTLEQRLKYYRRIDSAVHSLLQMLDEMMMVAELENGRLALQLQTTNLKGMIDKLIEEFRLIDGEKHHFVFSSDLPENAELDPKLVQHIITNFISNAVKYSPEGSKIVIQANVEEKEIVISVQDAGIGISENDLSHVFEPYFRADNARNIKGTGLGLALVKQVADVCGGTVEVTSELGVGSCFTVRLLV
jgi:signal transduction histidine kinase